MRVVFSLLAVALAGLGLVTSLVVVVVDGADVVDLSPDGIGSGVGLVQLLDCAGEPVRFDGRVVSGSGFLVGTRVLMTVEHGVLPVTAGRACGMRVRLGSEWYAVVGVNVWRERTADWRGTDLATLELDRDATGHLFEFGTSRAAIGTRLFALGYPLGGPYRSTPGELTRHVVDYGQPTVSARIDIEGGNSGGPIVTATGEVISIVSHVVVTGNLTTDGQHRSGGLDFERWAGNRLPGDLCAAHPTGGIPGCDGTARPEPLNSWFRVAVKRFS